MNLNDSIKQYLDKRAAEDELFAEALRKPGKSIKECCEYIYSQARKLAAGGKAVGIDDATVYGWAVHYYDEDDIKVDKVQERVEVATPDPVPSAKVESAVQPKPKKKTKKELFDEQRQLSLFDF